MQQGEGLNLAKLIGSQGTSDNWGENLFISKATEYLDDKSIIYWNREVFGREFDVCILLPNVGLLVVELKGWKEQNIIRVENSDTIIIATDEGEASSRPQKQARGYRFAIERRIRQSLGKAPLVFTMVCFPQVSSVFYREKRLDVVSEEDFTFLKEDLEDKATFVEKLNRAISNVSRWSRTPFDITTMKEVRSLFETDLAQDGETVEIAPQEKIVPLYKSEYSMFYFIIDASPIALETIKDLAEKYCTGCKVYAVFDSKTLLRQTVAALDEALTKRGLVRVRDNLEISYSQSTAHYPPVESISDSHMAFNCAMSVLHPMKDKETLPSAFCIQNGRIESEQISKWLQILADNSEFNLEQYLIEHADPEKNIVIRAGAGTGKTFTMISRIGYVCYMQNIPIHNMADRIVMITFTNEAADQMEEKLKTYFRNCYLITFRPDYLTMIARIDRMQISTIHSYAKNLIAILGTEFGYGTDLGITSTQFFRRRKVSDILDKYINEQKRKFGQDYITHLGTPVYALRDSVLDLINKLHNKSIDISSIQADDFGSVAPDSPYKELHELLSVVIPQVEREYSQELLDENRIHLSSMMSILNRFISNPESEKRIKELQKGRPQFMFVDEFQDTDDTQIETLLRLSNILEYRLFLVGDIKQCIYRFRGAKEKAFDQLNIMENPENWLEFSLRRNYRTDSLLLNLFDLSFTAWGARDDELLSYSAGSDRLVGTRNYNASICAYPDKFCRRITAEKEEMRIPKLIEEIRRTQVRLKYDEDHGLQLTQKEKSIAILVRENWQADIVRTEAAKVGISVQTNTGGDLYMSTPAMDMMTLVNALLHFDEADYLYNLVTSNFFAIEVPKSNLYEMRIKIRSEGWRAKADEKAQINYLIKIMNRLLVDTVQEYNTWELIIKSIRTKPILQAVREIYATLKPWNHYDKDSWKQEYYRLNVDLLFEQMINTFNADKLTINTLQEHLFNSIASGLSIDSRTPLTDTTTAPIQCLTVHKAKGLEYGHVILPFCSAPLDLIKKSQLHISTVKIGGETKIGYSINLNDGGLPAINEFYNEIVERAEKSREETRILYVAMTRAIRSFSWIIIGGRERLSWQTLIEVEAPDHAL